MPVLNSLFLLFLTLCCNIPTRRRDFINAHKPYLNHIRDALAPYHLHSQVPLTEESTALIRSKCIPGVTETGHNTMKKIKELTTQNDANERKNHRKRIEEIYFPYICAVTETSN